MRSREIFKKTKEKGGVALEYILVSTFAALATTLALGLMGKIAKKKIDSLAEKFEIESEFPEFDLFKN